MDNIYNKIAKKHNVSVEEVKRDMGAAIEYAYNKRFKTDSERVLQNSISYKRRTPTLEEFIEGIARKLI